MASKYYVNDWFGKVVLYLFDLFLPKAKKREIPSNFKSILISNIAHLGDVVLSTAVLEPIKKTYPHVKIGFLVSSSSKQVIEGHPLIDHIHTFDHWKFRRGKSSRFKAIREIRKMKYDIAIDLYVYYPNAITLFWLAGIPIRIGYRSGGAGPLLTHYLDRSDKHILEYHFDLLKFLSIDTFGKPSLPEKAFPIPKEEYIVVHMGDPTSPKSLPKEKWRELLKPYAGTQLVFTGYGKRENHQDGEGINLCNKISFQELVYLIKHCKLLLSIDSVPSHIAACFEKPCIIIFRETHTLEQWKPLNPNAEILHYLPFST